MFYSISDRDTYRTLLDKASETAAVDFCRLHPTPYLLSVTAWDEEAIGPDGLPEIAGQTSGEEFAEAPSSILAC